MYTAIYKIVSWRYYSALMTVFLLGVNFAAGYLILPDASTNPRHIRELGAALGFPILSGFSLFFLPLLGRKAEQAIMKSARFSGSCLKQAKLYGDQVRRVPRVSLGFAILLGPLLAISYMLSENLLYIEHLSPIDNAKRIPLIIEAVYFYIAITLLMISLVRITSLLSRFAANALNIELFHIEELSPLADSVLWNTVSVSIMMALSPLFWLGREPPTLDIIVVILVLITTLYLLLYPVVTVRKIVLKKKRLALERIRDAFKSSVKSNDSQKRRLTDSPRRMEDINNLVGVRKEISGTQEWPISVPVGIRIALVVLVPPLSWAGATMVEWAIMQLLS